MGKSESVEGVKEKPDTKHMRKYETDWGTIYVPLTVVARLGDATKVRVTVEAAE